MKKVTQDDMRSQGEPPHVSIGGCQATAPQGTRSLAGCIVSYNAGPEVRSALCGVLPQVSRGFVIDSASNLSLLMVFGILTGKRAKGRIEER